jgi:gamma-glutamyl:cysteine ligase YbdK (ATP-grasp superfamily)
MPGAAAALEQNYMNLQKQLAMLDDNCDPKQRKVLVDQVAAARRAYLSCTGKIFQDNDPQVANLTQQLEDANQKLSASAQQLGNLSATLDQVTQAVETAASLAKLAV